MTVVFDVMTTKLIVEEVSKRKRLLKHVRKAFAQILPNYATN